MKTKLTLILLLIISNIYAQEKDSLLWSSFQTELDKIIRIQTENEFIINETDYKQYDKKEFIRLLLNTSIEQQGMDYIAQHYGKDSLVLVRKFVSSVIDEIATDSKNSLNRRKAINYLLDYSLSPSISQFLLTDFDNEAKQKIVRFFSRQYTEGEVNFYAVTQAKYDMIKSKEWYDYYIPNYIKEQKQKYKKKVSYEEVWELFYQTNIAKYKENFVKFPVNDYELHHLKYLILNVGLLNIQEAIPYLKEYADSDKYNDEMRMYAVCALAAMRVENYEDRAITYFDVDMSGYTWLAEIINSQKVWYTYMRRLKSEKYNGYCPVAYSTIRILGNTLKKFPVTDRPRFETRVELDNGMIVGIPSEIKPIPLVPDDCGLSTQTTKTPINPDHIKVVVDWMESNKGKYELQREIDRAF